MTEGRWAREIIGLWWAGARERLLRGLCFALLCSALLCFACLQSLGLLALPVGASIRAPVPCLDATGQRRKSTGGRLLGDPGARPRYSSKLFATTPTWDPSARPDRWASSAEGAVLRPCFFRDNLTYTAHTYTTGKYELGVCMAATA